MSIDGFHLNGPYGGMLLIAVSLDTNNNSFPIAVALVENESGKSWIWFLNLVNEHIVGENMSALCYMLDRMKGCINALRRMVTNAHLRFCARYIYANFKGRWLGIKFKSSF